MMIFGAVVYYLFFVWDVTLDPINGYKGHFVRGVITVPVLLALSFLVSMPRFRQQIPLIVLIGISWVSLPLSYVLFLLEGGCDYGVAGLILIMLYSFTVVPLTIKYIAIFLFVSIVGFLIGQYFNPPTLSGTMVVNIIYLVGAALLGIVAVGTREIEARERFATGKELEAAHERIEELLYSMLPASIVQRLQSGESPVADSHGEVSIVFVDLVGFTELSRSVSPKRLLGILNSLFSRFDRVATQHGVDRIKTIGDAYMAVAGLNEDEMVIEHSIRAADFAISVREEVSVVAAEYGARLDVRIGLHVGSVVAGVVGTKRPAFDCWGEAVNLASRLEGASEKGRIVVSEVAALRLRSEFEIEQSDEVFLKGIGNTRLHFLEGRRERTKPALAV